MKTNETTPRFTRRSALALVLAGTVLPATKSPAPVDHTIEVPFYVIRRATSLITCSGEIIPAEFESEMLVGSGGAAKGFMRFFFGRDVIEYVAERGGLDFDSAGIPIRAVVLMSRRGGPGKVAQNFLLGTIASDPDPSEECLIYTTIGTDVHVEPVHFEVPGAWGVR